MVIQGTEPKTVLIRARGPALTEAGVDGALPDPNISFFYGANLIDSNDDWQDHENMSQVPASLSPGNSQESVIVRSLSPGAYTAIVTGINSEEGIGLIEVFELSDTGETRLINIATREFVGTLFSGATIINSNNDWQEHADAGKIPTNLIPTEDAEAVLYKELSAGAYTAIVTGVGDSTGVAIVEVFEIEY
ncbi:MAG: hypothetical protein ACI9CE_001279 [Flavobacterium sp.]